jgi:MFS family permease
MDGFDLLILGFMLRVISADLQLTPAQGASLVTATLVGAVFGGLVFGMLSDRLGRVRVLTWTIVLFAVFTGLCALAQGYWDLLIYRTMAGIGWRWSRKPGRHPSVRAPRPMSVWDGSSASWRRPS